MCGKEIGELSFAKSITKDTTYFNLHSGAVITVFCGQCTQFSGPMLYHDINQLSLQYCFFFFKQTIAEFNLSSMKISKFCQKLCSDCN